MKVDKILFHTRFREHSLDSLKTVLALKKAGLKEVVVIFVIEEEEVGFVPYGGYLKQKEKDLREKAAAEFKKWQNLLDQHQIKGKIRIEVGSANAIILKVAEDEKVDLIVIGRKKRSLLEKVYVGDHILDLLRRSQIPVMMSKYKVTYAVDDRELTRVNEHVFERPLLATDWSEPSAHALEALEAFKGLLQTVIIVHVLDEGSCQHLDQKQLEKVKAQNQQQLDGWCRELTADGLPAESKLAMGKLTPEIIRVSRDSQATLIVMGRTGKDWFQEYWLGGVSHRVAEHSELPVLLVP